MRRFARARLAPLGLALGALWALKTPDARALELQPPRYTRAQMEAALAGGARWRLVYGTRDPAATPPLRERALLLARRLFGGDSSAVVADRAFSEAEFATSAVVLLGAPRENEWTRKVASALPVQFADGRFTWRGRIYDREHDVLHLVWPNPYDPQRFLLVLAANRPAELATRGGGFFFGAEDWRIVREGELARAGTFAQSTAKPWSYDPALDRDREQDRERFVAALRSSGTHALIVRAPPAFAGADETRSAGEALLARMDAMGLAAPGARTATLTLYRSIEEKGAITRNTRPEHLGDTGDAHAARPFGRASLDLWSVVAMRLIRLGAAPQPEALEAAGAWLTGRLEGEPLEVAVSRLYFGRALPTAAQAATRSVAWRSPLIWTPARALLLRSVFESAGARKRTALLAALRAEAPGSLDSLCRSAGVDPARVARRYAQLADSLARSGSHALSTRRPQPWRPSDGFMRGVCVAHSVRLEGGYASAACARELASLKSMGCDWVSLTPFGYLPSLNRPEILPSAPGGPEEESDEAVCEAAARARALGLRVWLKPHLWSRGWAGALAFSGADWPKFFDRYGEFALHYALLAERERLDGFVVGHELASATAVAPDRWRALIGDVRRVYTGTLTYGANWDEAKRVTFWDQLDLIGVSFYAPLASAPTRSVAALTAGATRALAPLRELSARVGRPLLIDEVGYAPTPDAPVRPWEEGAGAPDAETQRACYEAFVAALEPADWVAGAFWWKWFSGPGDAGASFSPRGRPAQAVMARALKEWQGRPVRVLRPSRR